jgi:hypothetical protein
MPNSSELNTRFNMKNLKNIRKIDELEVALWPNKVNLETGGGPLAKEIPHV